MKGLVYIMLQWEREFLRDMAKEKVELSKSDYMQKRIKMWTDHNDLKGKIPMIHFEMGTVGDKGFNYQCKCESGDARSMEWNMGSQMANYKMVGDDRVVSDDFTIGNGFWMQPFGLSGKRTHTDGVGFHIDPVVDDLDNLDFIKESPMGFDHEGSVKWKEQVDDVLGDILDVRWGMGSIGLCPTQFLVNILGMETMFISMYDNPENFHIMMERLSDDYVTYLKETEKRGLLLPNNQNDWVGQGTFGYTTQLPSLADKKAEDFKLNDVWGYMDSQETVDISADMFNEFFFPYYKKIADNFGLLSYGCCEPVHSFWEKSLSNLTNLRKISISPWCDEEYMGEVLRERNIIFQRKPAPQFIGVGTYLDEDGFRAHMKKTILAAKGGKLEVTFRDTYNLSGQLDKPRRAVEIVRELIDEYWV